MKMPTTDWTQGAIDAKIPTSLLGLNNTWTGTTNTFSGAVTAGSFNTPSDYRIKEHVTPLDETYSVDGLNPVTYLNKKTNKPDIGLIAHELQQIYPLLVNGEKDGDETQSVNYTGLIPILINEIQNLKKENTNLEKGHNDLKNELDELKRDLSDLKRHDINK